MKYLKQFENYKGVIFDKSKFTLDDMNEIYELFQDIAITYNIKDMDSWRGDLDGIRLQNVSQLPSDFDDDPDTGEINQYIIGQHRNAFIDIRLFYNIDEVIEALRNNFIPMVKNTLDYRINMNLIYDENDIETPYTEISLTFLKK